MLRVKKNEIVFFFYFFLFLLFTSSIKFITVCFPHLYSTIYKPEVLLQLLSTFILLLNGFHVVNES
jgi:hypothetical protein